MGRISKTVLLLFLIVFTSSVLLPATTVKAQTRTLTVPDQYPTIQAAVDNASVGDAVFVKEGKYRIVNLEINKSIQLIGQNPHNTILDGDWERNRGTSLNAIVVSSSNVRISGFNITNFYQGIAVRSTNKISAIVISGNDIVGNSHSGVVLDVNSSATVCANNIYNNYIGLFVQSADSIISANSISKNGQGILTVIGTTNLTLADNDIAKNSSGISINSGTAVNIYGNNITGSKGTGLSFGASCNDATAHDNRIQQNGIGVVTTETEWLLPTLKIPQGSGNVIYHNIIADNSNYNAYIQHGYPNDKTVMENGTAYVSWDNGTVGNYWSDYNGNGSYVIDENNIDHYPLTQPVGTSMVTSAPTPQLTDGNAPHLDPIVYLIPVSIIVAVVVLSVMLYRRHRKTNSSGENHP